MRRGGRVLLHALCLVAWGAGASAEVVEDEQLWFNATLFGSVGNLAFFGEVQPRFGDGISRLNQIILRPAVGWKINDSLTVYQGYALVETPMTGGPSQTENRSFQQVSLESGEVLGTKLSSRMRLEERSVSTGRDIGWRLRGQLRGALPLTGNSNGIAALGWVEPFFALNDTDWGARAGFDRVRTFAGFEIPLAGKSTVEIGYLNQTVNGRARRIEVDHILSLNLFLRP